MGREEVKTDQERAADLALIDSLHSRGDGAPPPPQQQQQQPKKKRDSKIRQMAFIRKAPSLQRVARLEDTHRDESESTADTEFVLGLVEQRLSLQQTDTQTHTILAEFEHQHYGEKGGNAPQLATTALWGSTNTKAGVNPAPDFGRATEIDASYRTTTSRATNSTSQPGAYPFAPSTSQIQAVQTEDGALAVLDLEQGSGSGSSNTSWDTHSSKDASSSSLADENNDLQGHANGIPTVLAVANPISTAAEEAYKLGLPRAHEMFENEQLMSMDASHKSKQSIQELEGSLRRYTTISAIVGIALIVAIAVLVVLMVLILPAGSNKSASTTNAFDSNVSSVSTTTNTTLSPITPMEDYVLSVVLPDYTRETIQNDPGGDSPQSRSLIWLLQDPALPNYPDWRIQQRFAMASLYFSTNGDQWGDDYHWLNHSAHECTWYQKELFDYGIFDFFDNRTIPFTDSNAPNPCEQKEDEPAEEESHSQESIKHLWLYQNRLQGSLPPELQMLTALRSIDLHANTLTGSLPDKLDHLSNLQALMLIRNQLSGTIPADLANLSKLNHLILGVNHFSGSIPTELGGMGESVNYLLLTANQLTGQIPTEFGRLSNLIRLVLKENLLTGTIPSQMGLISTMEKFQLVLGDNSLTGSLPSELGQLTNLMELELNSNRLTGPAFPPPENVALWNKMSNLEELELSHNQLSGSIPGQLLAVLSNLRDFELANNPLLSGSIPTEIGLLTQMQKMQLQGCQLEGVLPTQLGQLSNIRLLRLNNNLLTGSIPFELEWLAMNGSLERIDLSSNYGLMGIVPEGLCDVTTMEFTCSQQLCGCNCTC